MRAKRGTVDCKSRVYATWSNMKQRCNNPKHPFFHSYGGRGISVCDEWQNSSAAFVNWATQNGYEDSLEIDRIDPNGNYEPSNCRFITREENARTRRCSISVEYNGKNYALIDLSKETGIPYATLFKRIKKIGMSVKDAVERPRDQWQTKRIMR